MTEGSWAVPGYQEIRELGRGASGRVVLAEHDATGVKVAIKYLAEQLREDDEFIRAFRAEARIMSEVDDPQVARLYEYVEATGGAAIVMELVDGVALRAILKEQGPTEPEAALVVLKGSLLGLAAAHGRGVVHRDYKPENVLVNGEGHSKLADFGISAHSGRQGPLAGTPSYMAPEQWVGAPASPSTDIYAATATFFECLTGHPPYRSPGDLVGMRRQHEQAPIPTDLVPEAVRGLVRRGLAKDAKQRPKDATTFLRELEAVAGAGYGEAWEEDGREKLARRALLLVLLFPLAAVAAQVGGTAVATTIFGMSRKAFITTLSGIAALALLFGGGAVALWPAANTLPLPVPAVSELFSPEPSPSPAASVDPSLDPSLSPTLDPPLSPTPAFTVKPSPSRSKSPSPKPSPSLSPSPKPTNSVLRLYARGFCWYSKLTCASDTYSGGFSRAGVTVTTTGTEAYTLTFRYIQVGPARVSPLPEYGKPIIKTVPVPAGLTTNTIDNVYQDLSGFWDDCNSRYRIKLTVTANIPGAISDALTIVDVGSCVIQ